MTSTADISFMLLIFFLVASSMDLDKGITRLLPPSDKVEEQQEMQVERDKLIALTITEENTLTLSNLEWTLQQGDTDRVMVRVPHIPDFNTDEDVRLSVNRLKEMGIQHIDEFTYIIR